MASKSARSPTSASTLATTVTLSTVAAAKAATSWRITLATASALVQALFYEVASLVAIGVYQGAIPTDGYVDDLSNNASIHFPKLLTSIYFRDDPLPNLPVLARPRQIQIYMIALAIASALLAATSVGVLFAQRCCSSSSVCWFVHIWVVVSGLATVVDIVLVAIFFKDLKQTFLWDDLYTFPGDQTALLLAPAFLLVLSARGFTLLIVNIVLMLCVVYEAASLRVYIVKERKAREAQFRHHAHEREDPLQAFVFDDNPLDEVELGAWNPAFEPEDRWSTFRPTATTRERPAVRILTTPASTATSPTGTGQHNMPSTSKIVAVSPPRVPEDDASADIRQHLSWMEHPEVHVNFTGENQSTSPSNGEVDRFKIPRPDYTPPARPKQQRHAHRH